MELSDEQLVLMTWDVAVRKGWGFVVDTLLCGGVDVSLPASGVCKGQGFRGQFGDWSQQGPISEDNLMVSQESGDEEEEMTVIDTSCLNSNEWPSWSGQCPKCSATILSPREEPPVLSTKGKYQGGTPGHSKIKEFIVEVTRVFHNYFSGLEMAGSRQTLPSCEPSGPALIYGQPGLSTGMWEQRPSKDAQAQVPSWDASSVPVGPLPTDAISRASPLPVMPVLPSVAVTGSVLPAPAGVADDFHCVKPLAAHVPKQLRETVGSLQFFDMFSLLQGQSTKGPGQKVDANDRTLVNWQKAFEVMGSILLEDAPEKMTGFFDYIATIRRAHDDLPEGAWHIYDQLFRKLKEAHPNMSWAVVHPQLWQKASKPVLHPQGEKAVGKTCQLYDKDKCKLAELCQFAHLCSICGGKHPKMRCRSSMHPKPSSREETVVRQQPQRDLDGKDTKHKEQKHPSKMHPVSLICRVYSHGHCKFGKDCKYKHLCSGCGEAHARVDCSKVELESKKRKLKTKQQLDDEAAMKKKPRQHQEPELGMGDFKVGTICSKCGGMHPSAECTIVKPGPEKLKQENQKNPSVGPVTKDYCTFYNKGECRVGEICRYKHVCSGCGDNHPRVKCSKLKSMSQPSNKRKTRRGKRRSTKKTRICQQYNIEKCKFGNICLFKHVCSQCYRPHPVAKCGSLNYLN
ncbi:uncharacterized protein LOC144755394 [Lissotriton helveticus]